MSNPDILWVYAVAVERCQLEHLIFGYRNSTSILVSSGVVQMIDKQPSAPLRLGDCLALRQYGCSDQPQLVASLPGWSQHTVLGTLDETALDVRYLAEARAVAIHQTLRKPPNLLLDFLFVARSLANRKSTLSRSLDVHVCPSGRCPSTRTSTSSPSW